MVTLATRTGYHGTIIEESLNKYGYKKQQGNTPKYERVKWLVIWNRSSFEFLWEIIQHITEFDGIDVTNIKQYKQTEDKLRKAFKDFEKFDLPVRKK